MSFRHIATLKFFGFVISSDAFSKIRKISNISNSNDSGYNDRGDIESLQEIMVRSCGSIMGEVLYKHDTHDSCIGFRLILIILA